MLITMVEVDDQSEDKNESELSKLDFQLSAEAVSKIEELNIMFEKQQSLHGKRKALIRKLLETLREDGFKDHQIVDIVLDRVKGVSRSTIYAALPQEVKRQYTKPLPKEINISTPHKVIDVEPQTRAQALENIHNLKQDIGMAGVKTDKTEVADILKHAGPLTEEDPKDLEIQFLKEQNEELKDALHKTQQFRPATQLQQQEPPSIANPDGDEHYFKFLTDRADGVSSFYYDRYGIDLFKNRILSQLKNSGVTTFKRLYFEV